MPRTVPEALPKDFQTKGDDQTSRAAATRGVTPRGYAAQFAYLVHRRKAIHGGDGTLLTDSLVMYASNLFEGDARDGERLPVALAGNGGGTLENRRITLASAMIIAKSAACLSLMNPPASKPVASETRTRYPRSCRNQQDGRKTSGSQSHENQISCQ